MSMKKLLAGVMSLTLVASAAVADFSVINTDINASAASVAQSNAPTISKNYQVGSLVTLPDVTGSWTGTDYKLNFTLTKSGTLDVKGRNCYSAVKICNASGVQVYSAYGTGSIKLNPGSYYLTVNIHTNEVGEISTSFIPSGERFTDMGDTLATANAVKLVPGYKSTAFKGFFAENDNVDCYKFTVSARVGMNVEISSPDFNFVDFEVYDSQRRKLKNFVTVSKTDKNYFKLNKGTYYLRIIKKSYVNGGAYTVKMSKYNPVKSHVLKVNTSNLKGKSAGDYTYVKTWTNNSSDTITYKSSNTKIFTVNKYGTIEFKRPGKAYLTVAASSSDKFDKVTKKIPIYVSPKQVRGISGRLVNNSNVAKITWNKDANATGYVFMYSTKKTSSGALVGAKKIRISGNKNNKAYIRNLQRNKTYYVKVCSYKKLSKTKTLYGPKSTLAGYTYKVRYYY